MGGPSDLLAHSDCPEQAPIDMRNAHVDVRACHVERWLVGVTLGNVGPEWRRLGVVTGEWLRLGWPHHPRIIIRSRGDVVSATGEPQVTVSPAAPLNCLT